MQGAKWAPVQKVRLSRCLLLFGALALFWTAHHMHFAQNISQTFRAAGNRVAIRSDEGSRFVIMTAASYPYRDFVRNLARSLLRAGNYRLLVASMDAGMHEYCGKHDIESVLLALEHQRSLDEVHTFGSQGFNVVTRHKLLAVRAALAAGFDVLFSDADVFWCAAGAREIAAYAGRGDDPRFDLVVQRTHVAYQEVNSGLYFARRSRRLLDFFDTMIAHGNSTEDDQVVMNKMLCGPQWGGEKIYGPRSGNATERELRQCRWEKRVAATFLPETRFPLGCTKVDGKMLIRHTAEFLRGKCERKEFALMHFSCVSSFFKKERMMERGMWVADDIGE